MNLDAYHRILAGESLTALLLPRALWRLTGPDAERYLNGQATNDIAHLADSRACYAAVCTAKGRMEGDVSIARRAGEFYLDADLVLRESLGARLEKYLIADDALFEDVSDLWSLRHVFGATPPFAPEAGFVAAYARFGLPGHDVWVANPKAAVAGATVEADVIETLRLEHGIPRWGAELSMATLPPEAGPHMLAAISYTKGCYVGQETIARLKSVGHVNRSLVFLQSDSAAFPAVGARLKLSDHETGVVTSSGYSPRLEKGIALGYAQRQAAVSGASLQTGGLNLTVTAPLSNKTTPG
ncbi:MAG TPA: glycine cleavage T C-terminal barrel domain-containing protein [Candidatus Methylacidiphilales bacterium]|jgi:folate-binding protein YgfZ|nr:glycine cleavage T C-terminal barrel domain-containing protein [Candidatus Methylacidiphilales bacterium]